MGGRVVDGWRLAVGTLTVVRVPPPRAVDREVAGLAAVVAPLAFAPVALLAGLAGWASSLVLPAPVAALLVVGVVALLTRAIHLDGLADTADGLGSGRPAEQALQIMRRGDVGPVGVVALVLVLGLQVASAAALLDREWGWFAVAAALVAGRGALTVVARRGVPSARPDGLGTVFSSNVPSLWTAVAWLALAGVLAVAAGASGGRWWQGALAAVLAAALTMIVAARATRRLGGITGDVLGAGVEVATTAALVVLAAG